MGRLRRILASRRGFLWKTAVPPHKTRQHKPYLEKHTAVSGRIVDRNFYKREGFSSKL
jgi:hypothetical protein